MIKLGCHVGNSGDLMLLGSAMEAISYKANCFMVYMGPPQNTFRKPVTALRAEEAKEYALNHGIKSEDIIVHLPYIVNLSQPDDEKFSYAIRFLTQEIINVGLCGFKYVVLHPGAHVGSGTEFGLKRIAQGIQKIFDNTTKSNVNILIETMAGKGTECGRTFEEVSTIISYLQDQERIGVCLDTCHIHDAGYDIVNDYDQVIEDFDHIIGLKYLKVLHINDSKNPCGSHKDRHENIGFGTIGFETLMKFIYDERFKDLPKILETPYVADVEDNRISYPPYRLEIEMIRNKKFNQNLKVLISEDKKM